MSRLLIRNARLVNEGQVFDADVLIANGRIEKIAASIQGDNEPVEIDANGQWLLPGMIDDQVHFREPGAPEKAASTANPARRWPAVSPASWTCPTPNRPP